MDDVPAYDTSKPLFIFDGVCVLCSGGVRWIMARDKAGKFNFCSAQSPLGQALYTRHGLNFDETYLIVDGGRAYTKSDGYLYMCRVLGGGWHIVRITALIPRPLRDWAYAIIARNRYRWFGKADYCALLTDAQRKKLL